MISHKIFGFFILLLSWEVLFSSSSSQKLLNFQSRREVIFSCYIYMREAGILFVQCSWEKSVERQLTIVEDVMSSANLGSFARTFRDGDKVFIMQLGANAYGNFVMI